MSAQTTQVVMVTLGMVLGNFAYQIFRVEPNYGQAFERSFFQVVAVFVVWLVVVRGEK